MNITKRKKHYITDIKTDNRKDNVKPLNWLLVLDDPRRNLRGTFDFSTFAKVRPNLAKHLRNVFWEMRNDRQIASLEHYFTNLHFFWDYLNDSASYASISELSDVDIDVLRGFILWLKTKQNGDGSFLSTSYQRAIYNSIKSLFSWLKKHSKEQVSNNLYFPKAPFPNASHFTSNREAYSEGELKQILRAIRIDLEELERKLEFTYVITRKGIDPRNNQTGLWKDIANVRWYFENILNCKHMARHQLDTVHHSFRTAAIKYHGGLKLLWKKLGVSPASVYKPMGTGVDPRQKESPWKSFENMIWYFENELGCRYHSTRYLYKYHRSFAQAAYLYHGGLKAVWEKLGIWSGTDAQSLFPFMIYFAILTGANPQSIYEMKRDCIKEHPFDQNKSFVVWTKYRSRLFEHHSEATLAVKTIKRALQITAKLVPLAGDKKDYLWLYVGDDGSIRVMATMTSCTLAQRFSTKHSIMGDNGQPLSINLARMRPSAATLMFDKCGNDIVKIQRILGHSSSQTTVGYLSKKTMKSRKETFFKGLILLEEKMRSNSDLDAVAKNLNTTAKSVKKLLNGDFDTFLGKCTDLVASPMPGEKKGQQCRRFHACIGCSKLIVTEKDLVKLLCYYNHIRSLQTFMHSENFMREYGWILRIIDDDILPRFEVGVVNKAREQAVHDKTFIWDRNIMLVKEIDKGYEV